MAVRVDSTITNEQRVRYAYMRDYGHEEFLAKAEKCDRFVLGNQWEPADLNKLRAENRPAMTINKTKSTVATLLGEQIQNRSEVLFRPKNGAPDETAEALNKVWMQIAANNQLPWVRSDVFLDGIVRSRGFYDVRLGFDDSMRGEVRIERYNSKNVLIDPDADEYDPDGWLDVILTKWLAIAEISALYGKDVGEYLEKKGHPTESYDKDMIDFVRDRFSGDALKGTNAAAEGEQPEVARRYRLLDRQYRLHTNREFFVDITTGDMREIPESWDENRIAAMKQKYGLQVVTKLVKRIKWCVTIDDVVVFEDWSPYKHLTIVPYFPLLQYGKSSGVVEHLLGPQELLNKSVSQELHIINTSANSGWIVKTNALRNMSIEELEVNGAKTGLVIEVEDPEAIEKIQPNQVPTGIDRITFKAEEFMKTISNVTDSMQGNDREDVAAKAIAYKQQRGSTNFSKDFDNLERSDYLLARNVLDIVQEFYTEERLINITHQDMAAQPETLTVNQVTPEGTIANDLTIGEYDITIVSAPYRATLEDSQFEQARAMREIGVKIPDTVLIENSRLNRKTELIKQIAGDSDSPEAQEARELDRRQRAAEVMGLEAEAQEKQTKSQLNAAKAQKEMQGDGGAQMEAQLEHERETAKMAQEMEMAKVQAAQEMEIARMKAEIERWKVEQEMALKQQEMEFEMKLKQETMEREMAIKEAVAVKQAAAAEAQAKAAAQQGAAPAGGNEGPVQH